MYWTVDFHPAFVEEFDEMGEAVQDRLLAGVELLREFGPALGRPHADTLNGSKYGNMKELRFRVENGVWRAAFAFDPSRQAIVLVAGNRVGRNEGQFYRTLIDIADRRYGEHLAWLGKDD
ncbi:MAG: addiction module toxin RelE [Caldilineaceae bacterium]|nr:addiction module toxin RelE [Caldilineaceae bacterium]